jgi:hypothetical protein
MEENYEEQSKVIYVNCVGPDHHWLRRTWFQCWSETSTQTLGSLRQRPLLSGSLSGGVSGSSSLSGSLSGAGAGHFVPGSGSCDFVPGSGSCDFVPGSGSCDFVPGSGSCDLVPNSGSCDFGSGSGSCYLVPELLVENPRQDMGYQKRKIATISNWSENVTHVLRGFPAFV